MKRYYIATLHVLLELEEDPGDGTVPELMNDQAAACDAISERMSGRDADPMIKDWGYAETEDCVPVPIRGIPDAFYAGPVEIAVDDANYLEGDLYNLVPPSHKIKR